MLTLRNVGQPRLRNTWRDQPNPQSGQRRLDLLRSLHIADKDFEGAENHRRWLDLYGVLIIHPPKRNSLKRSLSKRLRRRVASIRQILESVYDKLFNAFGLWRELPH